MEVCATYWAPHPSLSSSKFVFLLNSRVSDHEQQFTVFPWLNKNIHGIRVVPSEWDSLDWCTVERMWEPSRIDMHCMILALERANEYHQFETFFSRVPKCVYTAGYSVSAWSLFFMLLGYLQMCSSLLFPLCILFSKFGFWNLK